MMKTIQYFMIVFVTFILADASYGQYHGGNARASASDILSMTSCSFPAHFYAYTGGSSDGASVDLLMNTSCSAPPPSFIAYMGGSGDNAGSEDLISGICGTPPSFYAYLGGNGDTASLDEISAALCGTPAHFYAYFGGSGDGFSMDEIGSCPVTPPVASFTASATTVCVGSSVTFTDTSTNIPFVWSWTFTGGTPATSTIQNPEVVYNTPGVYAVSFTATNYNGSDTVTETGYITVTAVPTVATTTPGSRCNSGSVTLQATASAGVLRWYNVATGGAVLGTGPVFPTPSISATTTYYVEAMSGSCISARTAVVATVNVTPSVTATTPAERCGAGTLTLSATASAGILSWFAAASGGSALGTGVNFVTPSISATTIYYVQAANGSCASARTAVTATINSAPTVTSTTPGARCDTGVVTLSATASSGTLNWYATASGGSAIGTGTSFVTPSISATTTFYVEATNGVCASPRTAVIATASPTPVITATTPSGRCDAGSVTLSATANAGTVSWFDVATGGTALASGPVFVTPSISATTTYYVQTANGSCTSVRTPVIATVTPTPTVTATVPAGRCGAGSLTLGAAASAGTLNWYNVAVGGSVLATGTGFVTPTISATTTYYVEAANGNCASARTPVTATISIMPTILTTAPGTRCDAGSVSLSATASAGTLKWYNVATGGSALATGNNFVTPSISATTTYYVEATSGSCISPRTAVTATVNLTPTITGTTPGSRCDTGSVTLAATASSGILNWYSASTGGTALGTGASFVTPMIAATTTYYVEASNGSCLSARSGVIATVNATPAITATTPASRCDSGSVTLAAAANTGTISWYNVPTGGSALATGTTFATPTLNATATFYVEVSNESCTSARIAVVATVNATPSITATTPASRCGTGIVTLSAVSNIGTLSWFSSATGGSALATGNSFVTPALSTTTTYYVEASNASCISARTPVIATVNANPTITATTPANRCGNGSVTLTATSSTGTMNWYAAASGGSSLASGGAFVTPALSATTTYYVEVTNGSCTSARTPVLATINANPTITATVPATRCGSGEVTLQATANAGILSWFSTPTGGTALATGSLFQTPNLSATTTYYVEASNGSCTSARTPVIATLNIVAPPTGVASQTFCNGETVGQIVAAGTDVSWYDAAIGGNLIADGTPIVSGTTYYASQHLGSCDSEVRLAVTMTSGNCLGLGEIIRNELKVYPNPVDDILNISYSENISRVEVVNMVGQLVYAKTINAGETKIDMSGLAAGTYLVKISADQLFKTYKVIKR